MVSRYFKNFRLYNTIFIDDQIVKFYGKMTRFFWRSHELFIVKKNGSVHCNDNIFLLIFQIYLLNREKPCLLRVGIFLHRSNSEPKIIIIFYKK